MMRASSSRKTSSLPLRLNIAASLRAGPVIGTAPWHHSRGQQRLPFLLEDPIAFGHRGARAHAPENTLAGFELALKLGATGLERDVWVTQGGIPVLEHDGVVRKSLGRTRPIAELTRSALPSHIPSLAELIDRCGTGSPLPLDLRVAASGLVAVAVVPEAGPALLEKVWL